MPSPVVHAGVAFLVGVGLLGTYYDRRALLVIVGLLLLPEIDTLAGLVLEGAHRSLLHTLLLPISLTPLLYWDTVRDESWLRDRFGGYGVRLAWVGLFVHVFVQIGLDWSHLDGVNLFYPLLDRFFKLDGEAYLSTADGFVQTFVEVGTNPETGSPRVSVVPPCPTSTRGDPVSGFVPTSTNVWTNPSAVERYASPSSWKNRSRRG